MSGQMTFNKDAKTTQWIKASLFNKQCWENWISTYKRIKMNHVIVCLGYYNKIPQTGYLINNRNLFLIILEAGK